VKPTEPRMYHFQLLTHDEQRAAILRLSRSGMSDATIASAAGLSVEMIRTILGRPAPEAAQ